MRSFSAAALASAAIIGLAATTVAASEPVRVRGKIQSVQGDTLNVRSYSGKPIELMLNSQTKYQTVVPAQLSDIKKGDFVGVGATGPANDLRALEVHIFPASMRGTGEGENAWSVPVAVANADRQTTGAMPGTPAVNGTMTNGTVAGGSSEAAPPVAGTMTNGTVIASGSSEAAPPIAGTMTNGTVATGGRNAGGQKLAITYNGKQTSISVPAGAPVVRLTSGRPPELTPGAKIFALASEGNGSTLTAKSIAVGKKRTNAADVRASNSAFAR